MHQLIIENQKHPVIFERFCASLLSVSENMSIVTTSFNYDRGIDARSIQPTRGKHPFVLCVTLSRELDGKIAADILKLYKRCTPGTVYYCSSVRLTEDACLKLEATIRDLINKPVSVRVLGSIQLSDISETKPEILAKHFHSEIDNIKQVLEASAERSSDVEARSMRMALMAYGSADAQELRDTMSSQMILEALSSASGNEQDVATAISRDFALPKVLNSTFVLHCLRGAFAKGLVVQVSGKWKLTESGSVEATRVTPQAAANLLEGRVIIRSSLEMLIGKVLDDDQYEQVWMTLLDGLSDLFYSNGIGIVSAVSSFLNHSGSTQATDTNLPRLIGILSARVRAIFASEDLGSEVVIAIRDMFTERDGPAFNWIAGVCERFVIMCSLGLEATTADEIKALVVRSFIVLDTDIALTLLSPSEPDHEAVKELVANWKRIGGKFLLSLSVLEEVAYHAWISEYDFQGSKSLLGTLKGPELRRYSANTFVRAFHAQSKSKAETDYWPDYISSYRGSTQYDYSNIHRHLSRILGAETLADSTDISFESDMTAEVYGLRSTPMRQNTRDNRNEQKEKESIDKAKRDGRLLASIAFGREAQSRLGRDNTVVLISSSRKLGQIAQKNKVRFGSPDPVLSIGALSYLISLVPNVKLGPDTLRRALFEFGESARLKDHQRLALRVIKGSGLYQMGWATREHLTQKLNGVIYQEASKRDMSSVMFKQKFALGDPSTDPASIIAAALENMSVPSVLHQEVADLKRKLRAAQVQIDFLREPESKKSRSDSE